MGVLSRSHRVSSSANGLSVGPRLIPACWSGGPVSESTLAFLLLIPTVSSILSFPQHRLPRETTFYYT